MNTYEDEENISHFSISLLMNTYEDEENMSRQLKINRNIIYVLIVIQPYAVLFSHIISYITSWRGIVSFYCPRDE